MSVTDSIKAMPTIADEHGSPCVSQAAVLALLEGQAAKWDEGKVQTPNGELQAVGCRWVVKLCAAELAGERLSAERGSGK